jgi:hypothetical protein
MNDNSFESRPEGRETDCQTEWSSVQSPAEVRWFDSELFATWLRLARQGACRGET